MIGRRHFPTFLILLLMLSTAARAQYDFDSWTTDDGLPQNAVLSVAQTRDGYLWIGTFEGLARFDGVDFTVFDGSNTAEIKSNYILALLEDRQGNLWIGTDGGGLVRRTGDAFVRYSIADGLLSDSVTCLFEDRDGNIWIGSERGGLNRFQGGKINGYKLADGLPGSIVFAFAEDADGALWIGTDNGLARFENEKFTNYTVNDGLAGNLIYSLRQSRNNGLWIGTDKGLSRFENGIFTTATQSELSEQGIESLFEDDIGDLLIGTANKGLYRLRQGANVAEKMFGDSIGGKVRTIYRDADGALWIGAFNHGLIRWHKERFRSFTAVEGFPEESVWMVFEDREGNIWFSDFDKLYRLSKDGTLKSYPSSESLQLNITGIDEDADGNLWLGGNKGISKFDGTRFFSWTKEDGLSSNISTAILIDRAGNVWSGTTNQGLNKFQGGRFTVYKIEQGLANNFVQSLLEARGGAIWIGTDNGLSRFKDEQIISWKFGEGAASNSVLSLYEDADGAIWIGTSGGGLYRYKNEKFVNITSRDGLYDNLAFSLVESGGDLWMSGNKGVYRANLQELNDFADGKRTSIHSYFYDTDDGMPIRECNGGTPAGWKSRDGFLWFITPKGLVRAAPQMIDEKSPTVLVERVRLGDKLQSNIEKLEITPGQENLEIKYTAIGWHRPKHIKFKYRLEGLDANWTDAGNRRTAYFPYLPPGKYTFRVIADNGEGVWNETGKSISIKVLPPFYRTWWFFALCGLLIGGIVFLIYQRRINQLEKANAEQEEFSRKLLASQEQERQRIASELHDTLGQSLLIIKNRVALAQTDVDERETVEKQLSELSHSATAAIEECREIAYNLRPYQITRFGLSKTLYGIFMRLNEVTPIKATAEIDDIDGVLLPEAEINIYRIVQECVNNIIKHSAASEALLAVKRGDNEITILIEDDGRGFLQSSVKTNGKGGFGLMGIAERVKMLHGNCEIDSAPESGTRIRIKFEIMIGKKV